VDAVIQNQEPLVPGEEGKKSLEVILAALQSNETKQIIKVSELN